MPTRLFETPPARSALLTGLTLDALAAPVIFELGRFPAYDGMMVQLSAWVNAVDAVVSADASTTIIEFAYRGVGGGLLGPLPAFRLVKNTIGGAGTFAQDVNFVAVSAGAVVNGAIALNLIAQNTAGSPRTGNVSIRYWTNPGSF